MIWDTIRTNETAIQEKTEGKEAADGLGLPGILRTDRRNPGYVFFVSYRDNYPDYRSTSAEYLTPGVVHKVKDLFNTVINFFSKTRWLRTIRKIS